MSALLKDLALWMRRRLDSSQVARSNPSDSSSPVKTDGYTVVEIPDWEMRQKLEAVEDELKYCQ